MTTALVSMFTAGDGRPFEVRWLQPDFAHELWHWNDSHNPLPLSPMYEWVSLDPPGRLRAYEEAGVDPPAMFRGFEVHNGFQFTRDPNLRGNDRTQFVEKSRAFAGRFGGACAVWESYSLPRIQETCAVLQQAPASTSVAELSELFNYAFHLTHVAGMTMFQPLHWRLVGMLADSTPLDDALLLVQEIGQGGNNATVESDRLISQMAALAASDPAAHAAVEAERLDLLPAEGPFREAFDAYVQAYGFRPQTWGIDSPTVREQPGLVLSMVRQAGRAQQSPDEMRVAAERVREAALEVMRGKLAGRPEAMAAVESIADELKDYVAVREGRALWQHVSAGSLRTALLRKGAVMAEASLLAEADDVRYLQPGEVDAFFQTGQRDGDLRELVAARRAVQASWAATTPPRDISADPAKLPQAVMPTVDVVRGAPASRGVVTARARVLHNLSEAGQLQPGEVLVCVMTSPPWTPLFGLAAAVVTNSGGALSHPAIAAREYGIPSVVGTNVATTAIRTGDVVTVDGAAGTVTILERAAR